jgi:prepilin signal peptidase PulO-like enzyme (type II secretory pathway)
MITTYFVSIFAVWSFLIFRIVTVPENHTGFPLWIFYILGIAGIFLIWLNWKNTILISIIGAITVAHIGLLFAMTQTNTLMDYDVWLSKKMPDRPALLRKVLGQKSNL